MKCYDVMLGAHCVGKVNVITEGLYLRFQCKCSLPDDGIYKLMGLCETHSFDLGICVPDGDFFTVNRKISKRAFPEGQLKFYLQPQNSAHSETFEPIDTERPFNFIKYLPTAHFEVRNGNYGIVILQQLTNPHSAE